MPSPILHVRVAPAELEALDRLARASGVRRSDVARSLIRAGLAADRSPAAATDSFAVAPLPPPDWEDAARRLEALAPERWSDADDVLDGLLADPLLREAPGAE